MICKICNQNVKDSSFANYHLRKIHEITGKEYYDTFLKKEGEGICQNEGCENETAFKRINQGYADYCSRACTSRSSKAKTKAKATMLKNYGVEHALQSKEIRTQMEEKNLREKGVKNVFQMESVKEQIKKTNIENLGVEHPMQNKEVLEKSIKTNLDKYGTERASQNEDIKKKTEENNIAKYGVKSTAMLDTVIKKAIITNNEKYNYDYHFLNPLVKEHNKKMNRKNHWNSFFITLKMKKIKPLFDKNYFVDNDTFDFKCLRCGKKFTTDDATVYNINCGCLKTRSKYEDEIIDKLVTLGIKRENITPNKNFYENGKKVFESDIYLEDYATGIDYAGLYWHCMERRGKDYHQRKYNFFKRKNIPFIQVFENEWRDKEDIVLSIIKSKLNKNKVIYARKCIVKNVAVSDASDFLVQNHIQGSMPSEIKLGLYFNDELMALMTLGKSRFNKTYEYEILRFCNAINTTIVGGFSKLLKYFERNFNPKSIISYVNIRYFDGSSYNANKFIFKNLTKPNYFYFKNGKYQLESRIKFQKHKLKDALDIYDPNKTELENMSDNKYYRIYDAGNLVYIKDLSQSE